MAKFIKVQNSGESKRAALSESIPLLALYIVHPEHSALCDFGLSYILKNPMKGRS